jgi:RNA recognition motif-containing protein
MEINNTKIFVGNVPFDCTNKEFQEIFDNVEGYISGEVVTKYNSQNSRGFGFIILNTLENAKKILERNDIILKERVLRFTEYDSKNKKNIYHDDEYINNINNINNRYLMIKDIININREDIKEMFFDQEIGKYFIAVDRKTGNNLDYAIVEYYENTIQIKKILNDGFIIYKDNKYRVC